MAAERVQDGGITVELSHPGKVLFPDDGFTKRDLVEYYHGMADRMLPLLKDRPVTMIRYPDGIAAHSILQKNAPDYFPDWVTRAEVPKQGGSVHHVICDKPATLAYLANQACIELHVFLSRTEAVDRPDQVIFDLDPPGEGHFAEAVRAARLLRELLEGELGLTTFVKTTGGKGLHVHLPLVADADFDASRQFARQAAEVLVAREPGLLTLEQRRDKRGDRIYADVMRNGYAQTATAPYGVRGRSGAPVATPLHWAELDDTGLTPGRFTLATVPDRVAGQTGADDPWAGLARHRYRLAKAQQKLSELAPGS
jgi:bifunctional non-homologous end joining protein LigD